MTKKGSEDLTELTRRYAPEVLRTLATIALESGRGASRRRAIASLVARGFLTTNRPGNDDLARIVAMSDEEVDAVFRRSSR